LDLWLEECPQREQVVVDDPGMAIPPTGFDRTPTGGCETHDPVAGEEHAAR